MSQDYICSCTMASPINSWAHNSSRFQDKGVCLIVLVETFFFCLQYVWLCILRFSTDSSCDSRWQASLSKALAESEELEAKKTAKKVTTKARLAQLTKKKNIVVNSHITFDEDGEVRTTCDSLSVNICVLMLCFNL